MSCLLVDEWNICCFEKKREKNGAKKTMFSHYIKKLNDRAFIGKCNKSIFRRNFPSGIRTKQGAATLLLLKRWGECLLQRLRRRRCLP
jgi:hypothetical protein